MKRLWLCLIALSWSALAFAQPGTIFVNDRVQAGTTCPPVAQPGGGPGTIYTCTGTGAVYTWTGSSWVAVGAGGAIGGTIAANQVAYGSGANTIQGSGSLTYDGTSLTATGRVVTDKIRSIAVDRLLFETPNVTADAFLYQDNSAGENLYQLVFPGSGYIFGRDNGPSTAGELNLYQTVGLSRILLYTQVEMFSGETNVGVYGGTGIPHGVFGTSNTAVPLDLGQSNAPFANLYIAGSLTGTELYVTQLPTPSAPTITNVGTAGATTYSYKVVARTINNHSPVSAAGSTATGNNTLTGSNYNHIVWTPVTGAQFYDVYRTVGGATQGLISGAGVSAFDGFFDDTGFPGGGETAPTTNTTGVLYATNEVLTRLAIGSTTTDGLVLQNTTDAAAGAQQWSPRLRLAGKGWATGSGGSSQNAEWIVESKPIQGSSAPTVNLQFSRQIAAGGYGSTIVFQNDGTIQAGGDGSVNGAAFAVSADSRTGFYRDGSGNFAVGVAGTTGLTVSSTGVNTATLSIVSPLHVSTGTGMAVANVGANSCGTTTATIAGGSNAFEVTVGATSGSQCRVAFPVAAANRYDCVATNSTTANLVRATFVDTTHVDLTGTFVAGDVLTAVCFSR